MRSDKLSIIEASAKAIQQNNALIIAAFDDYHKIVAEHLSDLSFITEVKHQEYLKKLNNDLAHKYSEDNFYEYCHVAYKHLEYIIDIHQCSIERTPQYPRILAAFIASKRDRASKPESERSKIFAMDKFVIYYLSTIGLDCAYLRNKDYILTSIIYGLRNYQSHASDMQDIPSIIMKKIPLKNAHPWALELLADNNKYDVIKQHVEKFLCDCYRAIKMLIPA